MKAYLPVIFAGFLVGACASHIPQPTHVKMNEWSSEIVYVIHSHEIESLPDTLTFSEMRSRFGPPPRSEIDVGIYPRFTPGVDYRKPLGELIIGSAYMFFPKVENNDLVDIIVSFEGAEAIIVWPKTKSGMSLDAYWTKK